MQMINIEDCFGSMELVQTQKVEGTKLYMGGYAIHRDRTGREIRRTENQWNCSLECWTTEEAERLAGVRLGKGAGHD